MKEDSNKFTKTGIFIEREEEFIEVKIKDDDLDSTRLNCYVERYK
jgi:hypothetical protein